MIRDVRVALAAGLALSAVALLLTLSGSPATVAPGPHVPLATELTGTEHSSSVCQAGETLPRGTTAIRFSLKALIGPRIKVQAFAEGRLLTAGVRGAGWTANAVTVPVKRVARTVAGAKVCLAFNLSNETLELAGQRAPRTTAAVTGTGQVLVGRMRIEYLRPGVRSWWSLALATARHLGLGRAWAGTWVALLALILMGAALGLTVWRVLSLARSARERVPTAAWACAFVAALSAVTWSILTPPFEVPDETDHYAYAEHLAIGGLPPSSEKGYSAAEDIAVRDLRQYEVFLQPEKHSIFSLAEQRRLQAESVQAERLPRRAADIGGGLATGEPPLYYALEAIPLSVGGTVLERLALMRLLSALLAGIVAMFVFLFVRETLPGVAWAWTVGALGVALVPLLGFMSGAVNPDGLLFALSAALFYCLARGFRRGLTPRLALAIGALMGAGLATKLNFIGPTPGALLGLAVLARRASANGSRRRAAGSLALALAAIAVPVLATVLVNMLAHRPPLGRAIGVHIAAIGSHGTLPQELAYIWQLYLPRLPLMPRDFFVFAPRQIWFNGYVGLYGWLDTTFPTWVYNLALIPAAVIAGFCLRTLLTSRLALRRRATELGVYATIAAGLLLLLGVSSYREFPEFGASYGEARYLLPLLPLLGALLALAARGGGRRWGPVLGTLIVVLAFAHDIFSQLQLVARYYN